MDSIDARVERAMNQAIHRTDDSEPTALKDLVQNLAAGLDNSQLSLLVMWCNARGIRVVLERFPPERCASILAKLCEREEYRGIAARALLRLEEEKRISILNHWRQGGEEQPPYENSMLCLSSFNDEKVKIWNREGQEFELPDEYVFIDRWPEGFPHSAMKCAFCNQGYEKGQILYPTNCRNDHTYHEICEMKDERDKGIVEDYCACCGGGYQSRDELRSEIRERLVGERSRGSSNSL